ncbi:MAG: DUF4282 domain-containing protein [Cyanobacteria bacterium P01_A01_bin.3]
MAQNKGFFEKLFDLSFSYFIAPQIAGLLYVIGLGITCLVALVILVAAISEAGIGGLLIGLVLAVIVVPVYAIFLRVGLESFVATIRTAENTRIIAEDVIARRNQTPQNFPNF